jgi:hypothetical protein
MDDTSDTSSPRMQSVRAREDDEGVHDEGSRGEHDERGRAPHVRSMLSSLRTNWARHSVWTPFYCSEYIHPSSDLSHEEFATHFVVHHHRRRK